MFLIHYFITEMTDNEAERGEQLEQNVSEREKRNAKEI